MAAAQLKDSFVAALGAGGGEEGRSFDRLRTNVERVSRRALLGAAVALPIASAAWSSGPPPPSSGRSPSPSRGGWKRALARFEAAEGRARALEGRTLRPTRSRWRSRRLMGSGSR